MTKSYFVMMLLLPVALLAGPGPVQLQYIPNQPVLQTSSVDIELSQKGGRPATAQQQVKARLEITNKGSSGRIRELPVDVTIDLEAVKVGAEANGRTIAYDSEHADASPFMAQLSKIIGQPMQVSVGEDLQITAQSPEFVKLLKHLESFGGFRTSNLISEMFQHLFALAGHTLKIGEEYTQQLALGADQDIPVTVTYKVVGITDNEVRAVITGGFDSVQVENASLGGGGGEGKSLVLAGKISGKAVWSRKNALLYKTRLEYTYDGILTDGDEEIPIKVRLRHEDATKAI